MITTTMERMKYWRIRVVIFFAWREGEETDA
jgi:hypothetical protein